MLSPPKKVIYKQDSEEEDKDDDDAEEENMEEEDLEAQSTDEDYLPVTSIQKTRKVRTTFFILNKNWFFFFLSFSTFFFFFFFHFLSQKQIRQIKAVVNLGLGYFVGAKTAVNIVFEGSNIKWMMVRQT